MAKLQNRLAHLAEVTALLCLLTLFSGLLSAQESAEDEVELPPWVQLTLYQVEPTMVEEFLAVQREFKELAKKSEIPWRSVSTTAFFGHPHRFLVMTPLESLGTLDRPQRPSPERASLNSRLERCLTSQQSWAVYLVPGMSKPPALDSEPNLLIVNLAEVYPGREQDYSQVMINDFLPHFDENEVKYLSGSLAFGGKTGFIHLFFVDNFAALDDGSPVMQELGAEGAQQVMARFSGIVASSELWIARYLPEVSLRPEVPSE